MKQIRKLVVFVMLLSMLLCNGVLAVSAAQEKNEESIETCNISNPPLYRVDMDGNYYGCSTWESYDKAVAYYGKDRQYYTTACIFDDEFFNYYYWFDEGTKCFFGVLF